MRLGPLFALELLFSTEVSLTLFLALACALLLGLVLVRRCALGSVSLLGPLAGSYALAGALTAPFLDHAVSGLHTAAFVPPEGYTADLLNFVVPTNGELSGHGWVSSISNRSPATTANGGPWSACPR